MAFALVVLGLTLGDGGWRRRAALADAHLDKRSRSAARSDQSSCERTFGDRSLVVVYVRFGDPGDRSAMVNSDHEARRRLPIASASVMQVMNGGSTVQTSGLIVLGRRP